MCWSFVTFQLFVFTERFKNGFSLKSYTKDRLFMWILNSQVCVRLCVCRFADCILLDLFNAQIYNYINIWTSWRSRPPHPHPHPMLKQWWITLIFILDVCRFISDFYKYIWVWWTAGNDDVHRCQINFYHKTVLMFWVCVCLCFCYGVRTIVGF